MIFIAHYLQTRALAHEMIFENFETYASVAELEKQWRRPHGSPSTIELTSSERADGRFAMKWDYTIEKYAIRASFIDRDPRAYDAIRFWVRPDGTGRTLNIGLKNHAQKAFETKSLLPMRDKNPRWVTVPFSTLGPTAKDELLEEIWVMVGGAPGAGSILLDCFEFVRLPKFGVFESFERFTTPLDLYQAWKPIGPAAALGDVEVNTNRAFAESGEKSLKLSIKPGVDGVTSFVELDAWGATGLRF